MIRAECAATLPSNVFASLRQDWGVVLDESGGWVVGYSHFAPGVCGRYHPLAWPLRAGAGGVGDGFRADGALAFAGTCAFVGMGMPAVARRMVLVIRPDGSHALEEDGAGAGDPAVGGS